MKSKFAIAAIAAAVSVPMVAAAPAQAQYYDQRSAYQSNDYDGYREGYRDQGGYHGGERRDYRDGRAYRGRDVTYYRDCRRSSGNTGLIAGGAGGALIGGALGASPLGIILGAVGGGLLGKHLDKQNDAEQNYRNGC
jgi:hypothetical protein